MPIHTAPIQSITRLCRVISQAIHFNSNISPKTKMDFYKELNDYVKDTVLYHHTIENKITLLEYEIKQIKDKSYYKH